MTSRDQLIDAATELMRGDGYYGLGITAVLTSSGLTSGSLYHHFPGGKEELAIAVIDSASRRWSDLIDHAFAASDSADAAARWIFDVTANDLERADFGFSCEVGLPCSEAATPALVAAGDTAFAAWSARIADHFSAAGVNDSSALAEHTLVVYEGALLVARVRRDGGVLRRSGQQLADQVEIATKGAA